MFYYILDLINAVLLSLEKKKKAKSVYNPMQVVFLFIFFGFWVKYDLYMSYTKLKRDFSSVNRYDSVISMHLYYTCVSVI